jgi:fructokinase
VRIGVDLGGSKIEGVVLGDDGTESVRRRRPTPRDYEGTIETVARLVDELESAERRSTPPLAKKPRATVGIGMPGTISPATGVVKNANSTWLNGRPLQQDLERRLGRPIRLANDANCFALSEAVDGAAAGARVVFGVIVGTGTGGGLVVDGRVLTGPNAIAGEWGHNALPRPRGDEWPGPVCYCGQTGCIEVFLCGPGMARDHHESSGQELDPETIGRRAAEGDADCARTVDRYADRMARALSIVINVVDPDAIVLGGGLSNLQTLYERVPSLWGPYVFSDRVDTHLLAPRHGDASGVRGAAWLWAATESA